MSFRVYEAESGSLLAGVQCDVCFKDSGPDTGLIPDGPELVVVCGDACFVKWCAENDLRPGADVQYVSLQEFLSVLCARLGINPIGHATEQITKRLLAGT